MNTGTILAERRVQTAAFCGALFGVTGLVAAVLNLWRGWLAAPSFGLSHAIVSTQPDILLLSGAGLISIEILGRTQGRIRTLTATSVQLLCLVVVTVECFAHVFYLRTGATLDLSLAEYGLTFAREMTNVLYDQLSMAVIGWIAGVWLAVLGFPYLVSAVAGYVIRRRVPRQGAEEKPDAAHPVRPAPLRPLPIWATGCAAIVAAVAPGALGARVPSGTVSGLSSALLRGIVNSSGRDDEYGYFVDTVRKKAEVPPRSPTETGAPKNIAVIVLESVRWDAVGYHNPEMPTTPFLDLLAARSVVAERAYANTPHTTRALVSIFCGFPPDIRGLPDDTMPDAAPVACLPEILRAHGYRTAYFQSATEFFENRRILIQNLRFESFRPVESMPAAGFSRVNHFGFEDDIMLGPSEQWLTDNKDKPFLAAYLTVSTHFDYWPPAGFPLRKLDDDEVFNRYLNAVVYTDRFLSRLLEQYRRLGLERNTLFVIVGDHGEAFGEHGMRTHATVPYEEGIRVPLLLYDPSGTIKPRYVTPRISHLDILPTLTEALQLPFPRGSYPGRSFLSELPERPIDVYCSSRYGCSARLEGPWKYIDFGDSPRPAELYRIASDGSERKNEMARHEFIARKMQETLMTGRFGLDSTFNRLRRLATRRPDSSPSASTETTEGRP